MEKKPNNIIIPRILHQTVKDKTNIREDWKKCMATWSNKLGSNDNNNTHWEYRLWDDNENDEFVKTKYPQFYKLYHDLPYPINRVDFVRYLYMHAFGGFYADADTICLKSIEPLRTQGHIILGEHTFYLTRFVECAFMGSVPGHPFWLEMIEAIQEATYHPTITQRLSSNLPSMAVMTQTGPLLFGQVVKRAMARDHKHQIKLFPPHIFYPTPDGLPYPTDSYIVHMCNGSWVGSTERSIYQVLKHKILLTILIIVGLLIFAYVIFRLLFASSSSKSKSSYAADIYV